MLLSLVEALSSFKSVFHELKLLKMVYFIIVVVLDNQLEVLEAMCKIIVVNILLVCLNCTLLCFNRLVNVEHCILAFLAVFKQLQVFF